MSDQTTKAAHTPEHWDDQAALALNYARARPAADMKGFFAALRDSADFTKSRRHIPRGGPSEMGSFNNLRHPHMARGDYMFNGYAVVIDPRLRKEHVGDAVYSYRGHRFWQWLWPIIFRKSMPPSMERGRQLMRGPIYLAENKLFMTAETFQQLCAEGRSNG